MLNFIRTKIKSKIGAAFAIALLVLIALAFTSGDVANTGGFGGIAGGDRVASVGDERIDTSTLSQAASSALERVKRDNPTMSMQAFLANDGLEGVLENLIDRLAIAAFGKENGIVASARLIDSEIAQMPLFKGADGKFSDDLFRQAIQQRGISEQLLRDDLSQALIARQVMMPATVGVNMPRPLAKKYASMLAETRKGEIAILPTLAFAPKDKPTDEEIAAYYKKNHTDFIRPERRIIRYASFGPDILADIPAPTEAEVAFRYQANQDRYKASESRRITQVVVPTEAAANAVSVEVSRGQSLEQAAKTKGLSASKLDLLGKAALAQEFSAALADTVFATARGQLIKPAQSPLGWHIARVEEIKSKPARSLDQVRSELTSEIAAEKRRVAIADNLESIEDALDSGGNLVGEAKKFGLDVKQTEALTADGRVYLKPGQTIPQFLTPVLDTAFAMEPEEPQLAEAERGKTFVIFDITDIKQSAPAPLKDITVSVQAAYLQSLASIEAKKAARNIQAQIAQGKTIRAALRSVKKPLPPVQSITMARPELARMQQQQRDVPPPIALMFNMAEGTTKVQPAPNEQAWFVVSLTDIAPAKVSDGDRIIATARRELGTVMRREYSDALGRAIRDRVGVERNAGGIRAVKQQLGGER